MPVVVDHEPDRLPEAGGHRVGQTLGRGDAVRPRRLAGVEGEGELAPGRDHGAPSASPRRSRSIRDGSTRSAIPFSWL